MPESAWPPIVYSSPPPPLPTRRPIPLDTDALQYMVPLSRHRDNHRVAAERPDFPPPGYTFKAPPPSRPVPFHEPPEGRGWVILGFTSLGPVWFDTLAHYTTYRPPTAPAGTPQISLEPLDAILGISAPLPPHPRPGQCHSLKCNCPLCRP